MRTSANLKTRVGLYQMLRDVGVASLNKGQFPIACFTAVIISFLFRLPQADLSKLAFDTLTLFKELYLAGYGAAIICIIGWFINTRNLRRIHLYEIKRISDERNEWREKVLEAQRILHTK